jgi:hypothetical protein
MKKLIFYFCLLLISIINVNAQTPNWQWAKSDGGTSTDASDGVCTDASGNVFITGLFLSSTITFGTTTLTNAGSTDIFIVKYDATGNVLWAKSAGGAYGERGQSVCTDASGNVFITGHFYSPTITFGTITLTRANQTSDSTSDIFIVKYDTSGNVLWAKSAGGYGYDEGYAVCTNASGNVFITGRFTSPTISFGTDTLTNTNNTYDIFIVKYDTSGNVLWAKSAGGTGSDLGKGVSTDVSGNVFLTGNFGSPTISFGTAMLTNTNTAGNSPDIFIVKYDTSGNVLWAKSAGGTGNKLSTGVCTDASGNVIITGYFTSPTITFGTSMLTNTINNTYDFFIVKYDTSGNVLWAKSEGGTGHDLSYGVCTDASGNVIITGYFYSPIISFGFRTTTLINANEFSDIFIVKYDTSGNVLWAKSAGGTGTDLCRGVSTDVSGNVFLTGSFSSPTISFGTAMLTNTNNASDIFIAKLDGTTGINDIKHSNIKIYPNPTNNIINIEGLNKNENNTIQIFDVQGKLVITKNITEKGIIDLSELNKGVYVIKVGEVAQRIVKM